MGTREDIIAKLREIADALENDKADIITNSGMWVGPNYDRIDIRIKYKDKSDESTSE